MSQSRLLGCFTLSKAETFVKITDFETNTMLKFDKPMELAPGRWMLEIDNGHVIVSSIRRDFSVKVT